MDHKKRKGDDVGGDDVKRIKKKDGMARRTESTQANGTTHTTPVTNNGKGARPNNTPHRDSREDRSDLAIIAQRLKVQQKKLPIWQSNYNIDIKHNLRNISNVSIITAETGSGKSTQVPQMLAKEPWCVSKKVDIVRDGRQSTASVGGMVAITQPRRVAVTSLATRVAAEMGCRLRRGPGSEKDQVGYSIRFDSVVPEGCKIKYLTEGMLLRELAADPGLKKYSAIVVDEIHERSVDVDIITGFLRKMVKPNFTERGGVPMRVVIMSATANTGQIKDFFEQTLLGEEVFSSNDTNGVSALNGNHKEGSESSWSGIEETKSVPSSQNNGDLIMGCYRPDKFQLVTQQHITGKQYPVETFHLISPNDDYIGDMAQKVIYMHTKYPMPGDILCFLPGQTDIEAAEAEIQKKIEMQKMNTRSSPVPCIKIFKLYGSQPESEQKAALSRVTKPILAGKSVRKVILATNIAETSVTIPGVKYVIDSARAKIKRFRPELGFESLLVEKISKSAMQQRQGRAGRESAGKCFNLLTEDQAETAAEYDTPEIERSNIVSAVLSMKVAGIGDVYEFRLLSKPPLASVQGALEALHTIGAIDDKGMITEHGRKINRFPTSPEYAHVLVTASKADDGGRCLLLAIDTIAIASTDGDVFLHANSEDEHEAYASARSDLIRPEGDILTYAITMARYASEASDRTSWCAKHSISVPNMRKALKIRKQLRDLCARHKLYDGELPPDPQPFTPPSQEDARSLLKAFISAFVYQVAILKPDGTYQIATGTRELITIHPSSSLFGKKVEAIIYLEHQYTNKNYAKRVSRIEFQWVVDVMQQQLGTAA